MSFIDGETNVVIIGGGVSGAQAAYYLYHAGVKRIMVLESGEIGKGDPLEFARASGSSVFNSPVNKIKMMCQTYPCNSKYFISHHGLEGARRYLKLAYLGLALQKRLAKENLPSSSSTSSSSTSSYLTELGTLMVCLEHEVDELEEEFHLLVSLGANDLELWDRSRVQTAAGTQFFLGIFFPHDAIIDSSVYAKSLLAAVEASGAVRVVENCSPVKSVSTVSDGAGRDFAKTMLADGTVIESKFVVVATGGLFLDPHLCGIMSPAWSYLISIRDPTFSSSTTASTTTTASTSSHLLYPLRYTPNFLSWGLSHDWCVTNGYLRCSGEDHYSALKSPKDEERCAALYEWTIQTYPHLATCTGTAGATATATAATIGGVGVGGGGGEQYTSRYGVYSETPGKVSSFLSLYTTIHIPLIFVKPTY